MNWPDDYLIPGIEPYHVEKAGIIYCADCRDILPKLPKVDLVLTDPPYGVAFKYASFNDGNLISYCGLISEVIEELIVNPILITIGKRWLWAMPPAKDLLCWQKPGSTRRNNIGTFNEWELVLLYGNPPKKPHSDLIRLPDCVNHDANNNHPCPKPLKLFIWLLNNCSLDTSIVLDPFLGSGTTAVAAKELGRRFIGIEISEEYCKIAVKRLRQGVLNF